MKQVFAGEVYEVMPLSNGIIFSYCKDVIEKNVIVSYKMITFDNGHFTDVAKNIYLLTKFGSNYKSVTALCDNYITEKSILLPNGKVFLLSPDGTARLLDTDALPIWTGTFAYRGYKPADIVMAENSLWASYPECNALIRYSLATMREELRIGGKKSPFDKPRGMFLEGDTVTVSNLGSKSLVQVNLNTYSVFEYQTFEEPVYQYLNVCDHKFAVLQSGLYLI
ncbi:MAG: hypothetical protein IKD04_00930 [Clostridia bacterium]|nr:hypothetical protein [Clostridia bacterium]